MLKRRMAVVRLAAAGMLLVLAASAAAEEIKVNLIEVLGNRRIETATILAKIKTREGGVFSPAQIKEDIKALYQLGHFEDIQVKTEGFEDGLKVIFSVKEKPLLREISFEGNDEIITDDLKKEINLLPRTAYNIQLIQENAEKIQLKYQDRGFYNAVVAPVVSELRGGDRNVVYYIEEGGKVRLMDIIIEGNKAVSTDEIKGAMKNEEYGFFSFMGRSGALRMEELKEDVETVKNLYYNKGYIQVQVEEPVIEKKPPFITHTFTLMGETRTYTTYHGNDIALRINVKEGEQFRVGAVTIRGDTILMESEIREMMTLKAGDIFNREALRYDVNRIMERYDSLSRPFASVAPLFSIDTEKKTVAISVEIEEGGEVRIGRIEITGNTKTRDKVVRREMRLDEGDLYSKKALRRSYERIYNLNFFENIEILPERRQKEPVMDLDIKVKEKLTGTMSVGGGYSSLDGFIGIAEVTQGNLFGRGQLLKLKGQWGGIRRIYSLSFMEPYLFDKPIWGRVDLYNQTQEYDGYKLRTNGFGLSMGKSYGEYWSASLKYNFDRSQVYDKVTDALPLALTNQILYYGNTLDTSAVTAVVARDSRDFYLDPREGSRNSMTVEYAGGPLGGDPSFVKATLDSSWYFPLFWDTAFLVRGRTGYAASLIEQPFPLNDRFYVGGLNSVRGYRYGTLGPIDFYGNRLGGNKELIFNIEYGFPIVPEARLKGVIFYDMGRAFDDNESIRLGNLRHSFGWGFRWLTPIGPLRFEWGYIINQQKEDDENMFEFSIGTLF